MDSCSVIDFCWGQGSWLLLCYYFVGGMEILVAVSYVNTHKCQVDLQSFENSAGLYVDVFGLDWCWQLVGCLPRTFREPVCSLFIP